MSVIASGDMPPPPPNPAEPADRPPPLPDQRLYLPEHEAWRADIKRSWDNEYCYSANPGENYFHLLVSGELYVRRGDEKYCLRCALRRGILTTDRLYWQKGGSGPTISEGPAEAQPL